MNEYTDDEDDDTWAVLDFYMVHNNSGGVTNEGPFIVLLFTFSNVHTKSY